MSVLNYFILTSAQRTAAEAFDNEEVALGARAVDNPSPGVGINLNDLATDYDPGEPLTLVGCFVTEKSIVTNPEYLLYAPGMVAYLLDKPFATLESETIFNPPPPID